MHPSVGFVARRMHAQRAPGGQPLRMMKGPEFAQQTRNELGAPCATVSASGGCS